MILQKKVFNKNCFIIFILKKIVLSLIFAIIFVISTSEYISIRSSKKIGEFSYSELHPNFYMYNFMFFLKTSFREETTLNKFIETPIKTLWYMNNTLKYGTNKYFPKLYVSSNLFSGKFMVKKLPFALIYIFLNHHLSWSLTPPRAGPDRTRR